MQSNYTNNHLDKRRSTHQFYNEKQPKQNQIRYQIRESPDGDMQGGQFRDRSFETQMESSFFTQEEPIVVESFTTLQKVHLSMENDKWMWRYASDGFFTMAPTYQALAGSSLYFDESILNVLPEEPLSKLHPHLVRRASFTSMRSLTPMPQNFLNLHTSDHLIQEIL